MGQRLELNYEPLAKYKRPRILKKAGAIILGIMSFLVTPLFILPFRLSPLVFSLVLAILAVIVFLVVRHEIDRYNQAVLNMKAFAKANGLEFKERVGRVGQIGVVNRIDRPGSVFAIGRFNTIMMALSGRIGGLPFNLFNYVYTVGSGKNSRNYDVAVMEIILPRKLPHMVIDSLLEEGNGGQSTLPINFDKSQRIQLEGDFYKYFSLYAPDKYGVSALSIIAPDAMEVLLKHAALCDIEIIDDRLYFYWPKLPGSAEDYKETFNTVNEVLDEIGKKLTRSDIFANESQANVHAQPDVSGVRLAYVKFPKWGWLLVIVGIITVFTSVMYGVPPTSFLAISVSVAPMAIIILLGILRSIKRSRTRKLHEKRYAG